MEPGVKGVSRVIACVSLLVLTGLSSSARAENNAADSDRANLLFKKGKLAFNAGKYDDALRIYGEAWSLKRSPDIAANLAQTESELGKHRDAAEHYAFALAHLLPSSTDEQKHALADGLETEKSEIGSLRVTLEPSDSSLLLDDARVTVPSNGDVFVDPGEHQVSVTHEGYESKSQSLRISKGAAQVLWIKLEPSGAAAEPSTPDAPNVSDAPKPGDAPPPQPGERAGRSLVPAIIGGGLVAAGATVGVVFLLSGNSSQKSASALQDQLNERGGPSPCGAGTPYTADCAALHDKNVAVDQARTVEVIGFAVAGAAAVATVSYLLWPRAGTASASTRAPASTWTPTFALAPGAGSFGLAGRF